MGKLRKVGIIGVDGGGTACRLAVLREGQRVELTMGAANVTTDRETAIALVLAGLEELADRAGLGMAELQDFPAHLGLAGIMSEEDAADVARALPLSRVRITDDQSTAVIGALGEKDGAVSSIGTGSFVARRRGAQIDKIGGWGLVLGDEASGAWLGRGLLTATLHSTEGIVAATPLSEGLLEEFGGPNGIVAFARTATPREFATHAPRVAQAAIGGDPIALSLMQAGAQYIERALTTLGWDNAERLCLIGGLGAAYAPHLSSGVRHAVVPAEGTALDGALHFAAQLAEATA